MTKTTRALGLWGLLVGLAISFSGCSDKEQTASDQEENLAQLSTLPYASWVESDEEQDEDSTKITTDTPSPGLNLFAYRNQSSACLFDLSGKCLKKWSSSIANPKSWQYVDLDNQGNLYYLEKEEGIGDGRDGLGKLSLDNKLLWHNIGRYHHEIELISGQRLVTFISRERIISWHGEEIPVLDDLALVLDTNTGQILEEHSMFDLFKEHIRDEQIHSIKNWSEFDSIKSKIKSRPTDTTPIIGHDTIGDIFHANSIRYIDRKISDVANPNDYLISIRQLNAVAIISGDFTKIKWISKDEFRAQHQPSLLLSDSILVFDNQWRDGFSRVAEIDIKTKKIIWQYAAEKKNKFFSGTRGGAQRLPNGNTMITNSNRGKIFEVTPNGNVVWSFKNPEEKASRGRKFRAAIYRSKRFTEEQAKHILPDISLG
jgi:hypothetical protein